MGAVELSQEVSGSWHGQSMIEGDGRWTHDIRSAAVGDSGGFFTVSTVIVVLGSADVLGGYHKCEFKERE